MSLKHGPILALLTLLFFLRVLGQALVAFLSVSWLPPVERWYSGLIPYPFLFAIQLAMLIFMVIICMHISRGAGFFAEATTKRRSRKSLWTCGQRAWSFAKATEFGLRFPAVTFQDSIEIRIPTNRSRRRPKQPSRTRGFIMARLRRPD